MSQPSACDACGTQPNAGIFTVRPGDQGEVEQPYRCDLCALYPSDDAARRALAVTGNPWAPLPDGRALDQMAEYLSGEEWDAGTIEQIADWVRATGRAIADTEEAS
jgi:hypothetical protein